ncbi:DinB family protein [Arthrobacter sulfonylureivorans]|uniref:DinB family protein n=1 Tax=Arthrobacter sulfonylureivorans TaxID=2486855 RepID=A0ABY3WA27_9MICC|nr:DinB family protein [Arthrobacter sulfonylureivorans]UNK46055.1 DinB family protein [Arthrobacter sulfonylureivorans]
MTAVDGQDRPEPPEAANELDTLLGFLEFQRATLEWKCADLGADGLAAKLPPSRMTLGGMLKHLAFVEDYWLSRRLHGQEPQPPWDGVDWKAEPDWDWESAAADTLERLRELWASSVARSRVLTAEAVAAGGLDLMAGRPGRDGSVPNLRWILVHLIEEYSRHNGHADLLREAVDGLVGE